MADKVEMPVTGGEIDPSDPVGSGKNFVYAVIGILSLIAASVAAVSVWNWGAEQSESIDEVEVL